jgi:type III pantothenate kinase
VIGQTVFLVFNSGACFSAATVLLMSHTLLFDVGNTNTKVGLARADVISETYTLPTMVESTADAWGLRLLQILALHELEPRDVSAWVAASVVPPVSLLLRQACERFCNCPILFVPEDIPLSLENRYGRPSMDVPAR